jgi:hypothetical protein
MTNSAKALSVFITFLISHSLTTFAQKKPNNFLGIEYGVTIPIGNFGKKDISNEMSGFARPRSIVSAIFGHHIKNSRVGFIWSYSALKNGYDGEWLLEKYKATVPGIIVDTKPWTTKLFMPGIFYSLPLNDEVSAFYFKGMFGLSQATSSGYMVRGNDFSKIQRFEKSDLGLGYGLGLSFQTEVDPDGFSGINILFNSNYFSSSHTFKNVKTSAANSGETTTSIRQKFENITASIGLSISFY